MIRCLTPSTSPHSPLLCTPEGRNRRLAAEAELALAAAGADGAKVAGGAGSIGVVVGEDDTLVQCRVSEEDVLAKAEAAMELAESSISIRAATDDQIIDDDHAWFDPKRTLRMGFLGLCIGEIGLLPWHASKEDRSANILSSSASPPPHSSHTCAARGRRNKPLASVPRERDPRPCVVANRGREGDARRLHLGATGQHCLFGADAFARGG